MSLNIFSNIFSVSVSTSCHVCCRFYVSLLENLFFFLFVSIYANLC